MTAHTDPEDHTMTTWHVGRSWPPDTFIEDACPCPKAPCGLVDQGATSPECDQHHVGNGHYARTIRQAHHPDKCPGPSISQDLAAAVEQHAQLRADAGGREHQAEEKPRDHPQGTGTICDTCGTDVAAMAPETALSATQAAQEPSTGGNGWAEALTGLSGRCEIESIADGRGTFRLILSCNRKGCAWVIELDEPADLAELVRRAGEHTEVCR